MTRQSLVPICLIFLTRHCYLVSQLLTVKLLAPSPHSFQFCDLQMFLTKKRTFGDLCLNFLLGRERKKKKRKKKKSWPDLNCSNWIPKEGNPFSFHASLSPQAVQLCSGINPGGHSQAPCMGLPMALLSHCVSPTNHMMLLPSTPLRGHYCC